MSKKQIKIKKKSESVKAVSCTAVVQVKLTCRSGHVRFTGGDSDPDKTSSSFVRCLSTIHFSTVKDLPQ